MWGNERFLEIYFKVIYVVLNVIFVMLENWIKVSWYDEIYGRKFYYKCEILFIGIYWVLY